MTLIEYKIKDALLTIFPAGRIDSENAAEFEAKLQKIMGSESYEKIYLDLEKLEYISSAGLRVILRIRKREPSLQIINASPTVYEILNITGFTEMIPVRKAYRSLSLEGCQVIGEGANGKVYRIDADTIVKLYDNADSLPEIHKERELSRRAFVLGIPTAIPYDVVKVGDRYGTVFELLEAKTIADLICENPVKLDDYLEQFTDLLKIIHRSETEAGFLPDMKKTVLGWVDFIEDYLPAVTAGKLYQLVEDVPEDHHLLHGDYHIKNVMMQDGEVLLIDMETLCQGNPVFELGSIFNAFVGFSELDHSQSMKFFGISHEISVQIWEKVLALYLDTDDVIRKQEVEDKAMIIGYIRMMRRQIRRKGFEKEQGRREIENCRQHIIELVEKVDRLAF